MPDVTLPPKQRGPRAATITGERFDRLTVIERAGKDARNNALWLCVCDCGEQTIASTVRLRKGHKRSCGCLAREAGRKSLARIREAPNWDRGIKHGMRGTPTYYTWTAMKARCNNPNHHAWHRYGGRGITVCEHWLGPTGFATFLADMGERPATRSLDRIDNDGNYEPDNCRWATNAEQGRHARKLTEDDVRQIRISFANGSKQASLGRHFGVTQSAISAICRRENWSHVE